MSPREGKFMDYNDEDGPFENVHKKAMHMLMSFPGNDDAVQWVRSHMDAILGLVRLMEVTCKLILADERAIIPCADILSKLLAKPIVMEEIVLLYTRKDAVNDFKKDIGFITHATSGSLEVMGQLNMIVEAIRESSMFDEFLEDKDVKIFQRTYKREKRKLIIRSPPNPHNDLELDSKSNTDIDGDNYSPSLSVSLNTNSNEKDITKPKKSVKRKQKKRCIFEETSSESSKESTDNDIKKNKKKIKVEKSKKKGKGELTNKKRKSNSKKQKEDIKSSDDSFDEEINEMIQKSELEDKIKRFEHMNSTNAPTWMQGFFEVGVSRKSKSKKHSHSKITVDVSPGDSLIDDITDDSYNNDFNEEEEESYSSYDFDNSFRDRDRDRDDE